LTNPAKSASNSPAWKFSGCHWTPTQKRAAGTSAASMTPSGEVAVATNPLPSTRTA